MIRLPLEVLLSLLFFCSFSIAEQQLRSLADVNVPNNVVIDGFNDVDECYSALESADENGDRLIDSEEYVTVVQELSPPGTYDDVDSFADLPLGLKSTFSVLACLCRTNPSDDACCVGSNATLDTAGAFEGETPTDMQQSYLFFVCSYTYNAINMDTTAPTSIPTDEPTMAPISPTTAPVTSEPSETPTMGPTMEPTPSPSVSPTTTPVPTAPTATPSAAPSEAPVNVTVSVDYEIAIPEGTEQSVYVPQLIQAMDTLATQVLSESERRLVRRRLQTVALSTEVVGLSTSGTYAVVPSVVVTSRYRGNFVV